jgi:uncharacterized membrane protein YcjF (UPF0283 family)
MVEERTDDSLEMDDSTAERLVGLNSLMEELMQDASSLSKDLIDGIGAVGGAAAIILTIVVIEAVFLIVNLWRDVLFVAATLLVMIPLLIFGVRMLLKFFELRRRYARIYEIKKELEK